MRSKMHGQKDVFQNKKYEYKNNVYIKTNC